MKILKYQLWHLLSAAVLLAGIYFFVKENSTFLYGELLGLSTSTWLILSLLFPVLHQFYVAVCWRLELRYQSISKTFGTKGFFLYKIGFALLILSRPVLIILLAVSNTNTLQVKPVYAYLFSAVLLIPSAYLGYSVKRYFGIDRAFGEDHFYPEKYRNQSFIKQGIFKYTSNAMYNYGFLALYIPGLLLLSKTAVLAALFNHLFIWAHYYCTELPDIKVIYSNKQD